MKYVLITIMVLSLLLFAGCNKQEEMEDGKLCTAEYAPVCGMDGVTYSNACMAGNVAITYEGPCEDLCGPCPDLVPPSPEYCIGGELLPIEIDECGCMQPPKCKMDEKYTSCTTDEDCTCGTNFETGGCMVGNKDFIDSNIQCPDFCSGITGKLSVACIEGTCEQISNN